MHVSNWFSLSVPKDLPRWRLGSKHGKPLKQLIPSLLLCTELLCGLYYTTTEVRKPDPCLADNVDPPTAEQGAHVSPHSCHEHVGQISGQLSRIIPLGAATCNKYEHWVTSFPTGVPALPVAMLDVIQQQLLCFTYSRYTWGLVSQR